jgi:hypothetical protein
VVIELRLFCSVSMTSSAVIFRLFNADESDLCYFRHAADDCSFGKDSRPRSAAFGPRPHLLK